MKKGGAVRPNVEFGFCHMKVWLVRDLEPTPLDEGKPRLLRAGMLSAALAGRGHDTTWFTSSFNHYSRRQRQSGCFSLQPNLTLRVLPGLGYEKNVGLGRVFHNYRFGRCFLKTARETSLRPDVIIADLPTTEAAAAAVSFGQMEDIPTVVTIRDLWPDFFSDFAPPLLKPFVRVGLRPLDWQAQFACKHATSLIGISEGYLRWGQAKGGRRVGPDRVFYLGYPRPRFQERAEREHVLADMGIPASSDVASFVGSWGNTYDLPLVLETARRLCHRENLIVAVAGDWSVRPDLELAFRSLPNVRLLGWINKDQVSALLAHSTVGLLPYVKNAPQGLPNKIFEYMAYGVFQVATLGGEAKTLLEATGTGVSIPSATAADISDAIKRALEQESDHNQRLRRQAVFEERFEAGKIYSNLIDHVEQVVKGHFSDSN